VFSGIEETILQGLKPYGVRALFGTAQAVPLQGGFNLSHRQETGSFLRRDDPGGTNEVSDGPPSTHRFDVFVPSARDTLLLRRSPLLLIAALRLSI